PSMIFQQQFWIGGRGENGEWRSSLILLPNQDLDFVNGPASLDPSECIDWGHVWLVNGYEIAALKQDFMDGKLDQEPAYSLLVWPGRGNPYVEGLMGISLPDQSMAPFHDANLDGIYDPFDGDYPIVGEDCPSLVPTQMAWTIYNDKLGYKNLSDGLALGVEVGVTVFAVDFPSPDRILEESIFVRYDIQNISGEPLSDVRIGHFVDAEIGCNVDDLVGCHPETQTFYAYNNGPDPELCPGGKPGYGEYPPVLSMTFLSDSLDAFLYWNRLAPWTGLTGISIPEVIEHVFHGRWPDGTVITEGGSGYNSGGNPTKLLFTGIPSDTTSWSHIHLSNIEFGDRRLFGVTQPFALPIGGRKVHYAAYSAHREIGLTSLSQVDTALSRIPFLKTFYEYCFTLPIGNPMPCLSDCVWPGDMDANGICNNLDFLQWGVSIDRLGVARNHPFAGWLPQYALGWGNTGALDTDARHQDANGDGMIDRYDSTVISDNFGKTNQDDPDWGGYSVEGQEIMMTRMINALTWPDDIVPPDKRFMIRFDIADWPADSIYGIGYSIQYDPEVVMLEQMLNLVPKSSYLADQSELFSRQQDGSLDIAITKTDHQNLPFEPLELGKLMFKIKQQPIQVGFPDTTQIVVRHIKAYLADGTELTIGSHPISIPYGLITGLEEEKEPTAEFLISPNPTVDLIDWKASIPITSIALHSMDGKLVGQWHMDGMPTSGQIHVDLLTGCYVLSGLGVDGSVNRLKVIKH
ncbi:MAG TPA: hypothetical protein P5563_06015, partial [Saprospiraceae bacterium]|nr:hypothetical protein [Saprospiraceae bacterium]